MDTQPKPQADTAAGTTPPGNSPANNPPAPPPAAQTVVTGTITEADLRERFFWCDKCDDAADETCSCGQPAREVSAREQMRLLRDERNTARTEKNNVETAKKKLETDVAHLQDTRQRTLPPPPAAPPQMDKKNWLADFGL